MFPVELLCIACDLFWTVCYFSWLIDSLGPLSSLYLAQCSDRDFEAAKSRNIPPSPPSVRVAMQTYLTPEIYQTSNCVVLRSRSPGPCCQLDLRDMYKYPHSLILQNQELSSTYAYHTLQVPAPCLRSSVSVNCPIQYERRNRTIRRREDRPVHRYIQG